MADLEPRSQPDGYASHLPVLLACLRRTQGAILELGSGLFSTPLVHAFAVLGRYARTIETDPEWGRRIAAAFADRPAHFRHDFYVEPFDRQTLIRDTPWSLALVDHATAHRAPDLELLRTLGVGMAIVHDTEHPGYELGPVLDRFTYRYTYSRVPPETTVVSDTIPLHWLDAALSPLW